MSRRDYKEFGEGEWHHVFNRGNGKSDIFRDEQDYAVFLHRLGAVLGKEAAGQGRPLTSGGRERVRVTPFETNTFSLACYCLMPNHFHLLLRQEKDIPISALLLKVLTSYSMYFNRKYDHVGHVFQDRFKTVRIEDDAQLKHVSAYIHQNPKVARLVRDVCKWPHSSYPEYVEKNERGLCDTKMILELFKDAREYEKFVEESFKDIRDRKDVRELMMDE